MDQLLSTIYAVAVLLPLASFVAILLLANRLGRFAAWIATSAILGAGILPFLGLVLWLQHHFPAVGHGHSEAAAHGAEHSQDHPPTSGAHGDKANTDEHKDKTGAAAARLPLNYVALLQEPSAGTKRGP